MEETLDQSPVVKMDSASELPPKPSYKSFRKYRKIMVTFDNKMRESNLLFREHQRIMDISRRLSEQNDQLLELLYDLNGTPQTSPSYRFDLGAPTEDPRPATTDSMRPLTSDPDLNQRPVNKQVSPTNGQHFMDETELKKHTLRQESDSQPQISYASLLAVPLGSGDDTKTQNDDADMAVHGFLAPAEEERYLEGLDSYLNGVATTPRPFATAGARGGDRSAEKDRETALKNPVSVYNWLRKHQPQVFLQDNEAHPEKPTTRPAASRASKRASGVKQEPDLYDEDGIAIDAGSTVKGKRKRDDDGGYRPKGGNGRPSKRKKEEGSTSAKKSKRASLT